MPDMNEIDRLTDAHGEDAAGYARAYLDYVGRLTRELDPKSIGAMIAVLEGARVRGATVFFIGNGGSAATATPLHSKAARPAWGQWANGRLGTGPAIALVLARNGCVAAKMSPLAVTLGNRG
jgi:hypothetical protein